MLPQFTSLPEWDLLGAFRKAPFDLCVDFLCGSATAQRRRREKLENVLAMARSVSRYAPH